MHPARLLCAILALVVPSTAFAQAPATNLRLDSAVFVTRLGSDTLVIERVIRSPRRLEAEVAMRVPRTTRTTYVLELSPTGALERMEALTFDPAGGSQPTRRQLIVRAGDSLRIENTRTEEPAPAVAVAKVAADQNVLPFIDMVHWPYEIALMRFNAAGIRQAPQPFLMGVRASNFPFARIDGDSMTITHPTRGTMRVYVDATGRLMALDASATTRKLIVERRPWMPIDDIVRRWTQEDAAGRSLGALSGRARTTNSVGEATISLDYGTPSKRGRSIWGGLVPFGAVWRTGANEATHFETNYDLVLGTGRDTLLVPAGRYTLFSVPERDGGWLIINRQTGQAGTAYDALRDLGRVRLTTRPLTDPVETFTIKAEPGTTAHVLRLQWDTSERVVPFRVRAK